MHHGIRGIALLPDVQIRRLLAPNRGLELSFAGVDLPDLGKHPMLAEGLRALQDSTSRD